MRQILLHTKALFRREAAGNIQDLLPGQVVPVWQGQRWLAQLNIATFVAVVEDDGNTRCCLSGDDGSPLTPTGTRKATAFPAYQKKVRQHRQLPIIGDGGWCTPNDGESSAEWAALSTEQPVLRSWLFAAPTRVLPANCWLMPCIGRLLTKDQFQYGDQLCLDLDKKRTGLFRPLLPLPVGQPLKSKTWYGKHRDTVRDGVLEVGLATNLLEIARTLSEAPGTLYLGWYWLGDPTSLDDAKIMPKAVPRTAPPHVDRHGPSAYGLTQTEPTAWDRWYQENVLRGTPEFSHEMCRALDEVAYDLTGVDQDEVFGHIEALEDRAVEAVLEGQLQVA